VVTPPVLAPGADGWAAEPSRHRRKSRLDETNRALTPYLACIAVVSPLRPAGNLVPVFTRQRTRAARDVAAIRRRYAIKGRSHIEGSTSWKGKPMKQTTKTASRKTMRVATVFTGAAACATAFTPAAGIMGTGQHTIAQPARQARLDAVIRPAQWNYTSKDMQRVTGITACEARPNWVQIVSVKAGTGENLVCFGHSGVWTPTNGSSFSGWTICGGNNIGGYVGSYGGPVAGDELRYDATFGPGTTFVDLPHLPTKFASPWGDVVIISWQGNDKCFG
jgi:hypothetical protein